MVGKIVLESTPWGQTVTRIVVPESEGLYITRTRDGFEVGTGWNDSEHMQTGTTIRMNVYVPELLVLMALHTVRARTALPSLAQQVLDRNLN